MGEPVPYENATSGARAREEITALLRRCEPDTGRCADRYGRTLATLASPAGDLARRKNLLPDAPAAQPILL